MIDYSRLIEKARSFPIEVIVRKHNLGLRGSKIERDGPCPRSGGTNRFSINTKKQLWNCRRCKTGGDVSALVQFLDGDCGFRQAIETLTGEQTGNAIRSSRPSAPRCE